MEGHPYLFVTFLVLVIVAVILSIIVARSQAKDAKMKGEKELKAYYKSNSIKAIIIVGFGLIVLIIKWIYEAKLS